MSLSGHFQLCSITLPESQEWTIPQSVWIFVQSIDGHGYIVAQQILREFNAGDVLAAFLRDTTRVRASRLGPLKLHYFRILPELLAGFFSLAELVQLNAATENGNGILRLVSGSTPDARAFAQLTCDADRSVVWRAHALDWVAQHCLEFRCEAAAAEAAGRPCKQRFRQLVGELPASEFQLCRLRDLADFCGCSKKHFAHLFRMHFGASFRRLHEQIFARVKK